MSDILKTYIRRKPNSANLKGEIYGLLLAKKVTPNLVGVGWSIITPGDTFVLSYAHTYALSRALKAAYPSDENPDTPKPCVPGKVKRMLPVFVQRCKRYFGEDVEIYVNSYPKLNQYRDETPNAETREAMAEANEMLAKRKN